MKSRLDHVLLRTAVLCCVILFCASSTSAAGTGKNRKPTADRRQAYGPLVVADLGSNGGGGGGGGGGGRRPGSWTAFAAEPEDVDEYVGDAVGDEHEADDAEVDGEDHDDNDGEQGDGGRNQQQQDQQQQQFGAPPPPYVVRIRANLGGRPLSNDDDGRPSEYQQPQQQSGWTPIPRPGYNAPGGGAADDRPVFVDEDVDFIEGVDDGYGNDGNRGGGGGFREGDADHDFPHSTGTRNNNNNNNNEYDFKDVPDADDPSFLTLIRDAPEAAPAAATADNDDEDGNNDGGKAENDDDDDRDGEQHEGGRQRGLFDDGEGEGEGDGDGGVPVVDDSLASALASAVEDDDDEQAEERLQQQQHQAGAATDNYPKRVRAPRAANRRNFVPSTLYRAQVRDSNPAPTYAKPLAAAPPRIKKPSAAAAANPRRRRTKKIRRRYSSLASESNDNRPQYLDSPVLRDDARLAIGSGEHDDDDGSRHRHHQASDNYHVPKASSSYHDLHSDSGYEDHHSNHKSKAQPYHFQYYVKDDYTHNDFGQHERSDGKSVYGSYRVKLPDGRTQIVTYTADHLSGFQANVKYEGTAHHPPPSYYKESTATY